MKRVLAGKRVLVTGASGGIGRALAGQAVQAGAKVALTARSADVLAELARSLRAVGGEAFAVPADLTVPGEREQVIAAVEGRWGGLDVLVNNAGVASFGHFATSSEAILRTVVEVNFFAPAELTRLAMPLLRRGGQPAVVNVASMCGRCAMPAWPEYSASKFALCGLTEALRAEFARFDVDVLLVVPGLTQTELRRHMLRNDGMLKIDPNRGLTADAVAAATLRALVRNRAETVVGPDARWMLRAQKFFPRLLNVLLARRVRQLYADARREEALA